MQVKHFNPKSLVTTAFNNLHFQGALNSFQWNHHGFFRVVALTSVLSNTDLQIYATDQWQAILAVLTRVTESKMEEAGILAVLDCSLLFNQLCRSKTIPQ